LPLDLFDPTAALLLTIGAILPPAELLLEPEILLVRICENVGITDDVKRRRRRSKPATLICFRMLPRNKSALRIFKLLFGIGLCLERLVRVTWTFKSVDRQEPKVFRLAASTPDQIVDKG